MVQPPKSMERGRSATPRRNVNSSPLSLEIPNSIEEKKTPGAYDEDKSDMSLGSCVFVPFILEERREDQETTIRPTTPEGEQTMKDRKRDAAISPPKNRSQMQHDVDLNEIEIVSHYVEDQDQMTEQHLSPEGSFNAGCYYGAPTEENDQIKQQCICVSSIPDDRSITILMEYITDTLSITDSTASTQKASGASKRKPSIELELSTEKIIPTFGANDLLPWRRSTSRSTISTHSDISYANEEVLVGTEILNSVPPNDVTNKAYLLKHADLDSTLAPRQFSTSNCFFKLRNQKPSRMLKRSLEAISVLVYGKRIARHNFIHEE
jgi:hypothetical protein